MAARQDNVISIMLRQVYYFILVIVFFLKLFLYLNWKNSTNLCDEWADLHFKTKQFPEAFFHYLRKGKQSECVTCWSCVKYHSWKIHTLNQSVNK